MRRGLLSGLSRVGRRGGALGLNAAPMLWRARAAPSLWGLAGAAAALAFGGGVLLAADSGSSSPKEGPRTDYVDVDESGKSKQAVRVLAPDEEPAPVEPLPKRYYRAVKHFISNNPVAVFYRQLKAFLSEKVFFFLPTGKRSKPVIPPMLPPQYRKPFVLVMDLEALILTGYSPASGWTTRKRAGVDYFLNYASQLAEIIVFCDTLTGPIGWTMMTRLDPQGLISYKFFKEHEKDVFALERPMERMLIMGPNEKAYPGAEANFILLPPFVNGDEDATLFYVSQFLQDLMRVNTQFPDVREVLRRFKEKNNDIVTVWKNKALAQKNESKDLIGAKKLLGGRH